MKYQIIMDIFFTLLSRKKVSAHELAEKNGISVRSVYRYVDEMIIAGIPLDRQPGRNGGVYISDSYKLPVNFMTEQEYLAAIDAMRAMRGQIENKALDSAIEKLACQLKNEKTELSLTGDVIVDSSSWGDYRFNDKLRLLQNCIQSQESLVVDYVSRTGEHTKRVIEPHVLIYKQNVWYVYAYCHKRKEFRLFKAGRIRTALKTEKKFKKRNFLREDIPLQFKQESVTPIDVKLEIAPEALPDAEEWLGIDCIHKYDEKFYASVSLPDNDGLIEKILSLGTKIKVVYPERIKEAVKNAAAEIITLYE